MHLSTKTKQFIKSIKLIHIVFIRWNTMIQILDIKCVVGCWHTKQTVLFSFQISKRVFFTTFTYHFMTQYKSFNWQNFRAMVSNTSLVESIGLKYAYIIYFICNFTLLYNKQVLNRNRKSFRKRRPLPDSNACNITDMVRVFFYKQYVYNHVTSTKSTWTGNIKILSAALN